MKRRSICQLLILGVVFGCTGAVSLGAEVGKVGKVSLVAPEPVPVYVGTYTRGTSKGIYLYHLDLISGVLKPDGCAAEVANPSFLALHPSRPLLYAVGEVASFGDKKGGVVDAFAIDPTSGKLTLLNQQSSQGPGPCHLTVDHGGKCVVVANYGGGSVACLPIQADGRLGEATCFVQHAGSSVHPQRQQGPHAHGAYVDASDRFVFVADLGLDKLMIYRLDAAQAKLTANDPPFLATAAVRWPAALRFSSQRPPRLPDQRTELDDDGAQL